PRAGRDDRSGGLALPPRPRPPAPPLPGQHVRDRPLARVRALLRGLRRLPGPLRAEGRAARAPGGDRASELRRRRRRSRQRLPPPRIRSGRYVLSPRDAQARGPAGVHPQDARDRRRAARAVQAPPERERGAGAARKRARGTPRAHHRGRGHAAHGGELRRAGDAVLDGGALGGRARQGGPFRPRPRRPATPGAAADGRHVGAPHRRRVPHGAGGRGVKPESGEVLALIPARGGSKGIPRKNVRLFAGFPLLAWSIAAARASARTRRVVVSTDDPAIATVAEGFGAEAPFLRPPELAGDDTPDLPVFIHALAWLDREQGYRPD